MRGYNFKLIAASYATPQGTISKPWSITLAADDPRVAKYMHNHAFEQSPVDIPDKASKPAAKPADSVTSPTDLVKLADYIPKDKVQLLADAGLTSVEDILAGGEEQLLAIKGIGKKMAQTILDACKDIQEEA